MKLTAKQKDTLQERFYNIVVGASLEDLVESEDFKDFVAGEEDCNTTKATVVRDCDYIFADIYRFIEGL